MANQIPVRIQNMNYSPDPVTVNAGDSIVWTNYDNDWHTATADDGSSFDTKKLNPGDSSTPQLISGAARDISYGCQNHPSMSGTVSVR